MQKITKSLIIIIGSLGSIFFMLDSMNIIDAFLIIDTIKISLSNSTLTILSGVGGVITFCFAFWVIKNDTQSIFDVFKKEKKEKSFEEREYESRYRKPKGKEQPFDEKKP